MQSAVEYSVPGDDNRDNRIGRDDNGDDSSDYDGNDSIENYNNSNVIMTTKIPTAIRSINLMLSSPSSLLLMFVFLHLKILVIFRLTPYLICFFISFLLI